MAYEPLKIHSLAAHTMKFGGVTLKGFGENDACEFARNEESFKIVPGCDSTVTRYATGRFDGRGTIYLMSSSSINAAMAALVVADELAANGLGAVPLYIRNRNGTLVLEAEQAWIVKPADVSIGAAPKVRNWIVETNNLRMFSGS